MTIESEDLLARRAQAESTTRIQDEIASFWSAMLTDEKERERVAGILQIPPAKVGDLVEAPIRVRSAQANIGSSDVGLIVASWIASEVLLGAFKDIAKDEVKRHLKALWAYVADRIDERFVGKATGWPAELPERSEPTFSEPADPRDEPSTAR